MSYSLNLDIQSHEAAEAIGGRIAVAASGSGRKVRVATAAADKIIGVSERMGGTVGQMTDVIERGRTEAVAGGVIAFGDPLTAGAGGRLVKLVPVNGTVMSLIGFARSDAVAGDIFPILVAPSLIG